jgi:hypothetical protein
MESEHDGESRPGRSRNLFMAYNYRYYAADLRQTYTQFAQRVEDASLT